MRPVPSGMKRIKMAEHEDDFLNIISNNNLEQFMSESSVENMSVRELQIGMKHLAEALMIIADFIHTFFMAMENEDEDDRPGLSTDSIVFAQEMIANAKKFCESLYVDDDDEDYDDDDDEFEDDDDDE